MGRTGLIENARRARTDTHGVMTDLENGSVHVYYPEHGTHALKTIHFSVNETSGVAVAAYNSPRNLNALTKTQMMETFLVLEHCKRSSNVRCLVWTATGDRAFNAGAA